MFLLLGRLHEQEIRSRCTGQSVRNDFARFVNRAPNRDGILRLLIVRRDHVDLHSINTRYIMSDPNHGQFFCVWYLRGWPLRCPCGCPLCRSRWKRPTCAESKYSFGFALSIWFTDILTPEFCPRGCPRGRPCQSQTSRRESRGKQIEREEVRESVLIPVRAAFAQNLQSGNFDVSAMSVWVNNGVSAGRALEKVTLRPAVNFAHFVASNLISD